MQISTYCSAVLHTFPHLPPGLIPIEKDEDKVLYHEDVTLENKRMDRLATRGHATVQGCEIEEAVVHQLTIKKSLFKKIYVSGSLDAQYSKLGKVHLYPKGTAVLSNCVYTNMSGSAEVVGEQASHVKMSSCADFNISLLSQGTLVLDECFHCNASINGTSVISNSSVHQAQLIGPAALKECGIEWLTVDAKYHLDLQSTRVGKMDVYFSNESGEPQAPVLHLTNCHVRQLVFHSAKPGVVVMHGVGAVKSIENGRLLETPISKL